MLCSTVTQNLCMVFPLPMDIIHYSGVGWYEYSRLYNILQKKMLLTYHYAAASSHYLMEW